MAIAINESPIMNDNFLLDTVWIGITMNTITLTFPGMFRCFFIPKFESLKLKSTAHHHYDHSSRG